MLPLVMMLFQARELYPKGIYLAFSRMYGRKSEGEAPFLKGWVVRQTLPQGARQTSE